MTRHVFLVNLRDDPAAIAAYRDHHQRVWPEVVDSLRRAGVHAMDIHLLGRTAVMIVEVGDVDVRRAFAAHRASSPRGVEWGQLMRSLQAPSPDAVPCARWARMGRVFRLAAELRAV